MAGYDGTNTSRSRARYRSVPLGVDPNLSGDSRKLSLDSPESRSYLWVGRILHVDTETMVCSIMLETGLGERHDVPLPAPGGGGPRSWSGNFPEPGSKVLLAWRRFGNRAFAPQIVGWMTVGTFSAREFEPFSTVDPDEAAEALKLHPELEDDPRVNLDVVRMKSRKCYSGDFLASASGGADIVLDKDVLLTNRAGNEIRLRDADQTIIIQAQNVFESNSAGTYRRGLIKRNAFNFQPDLALAGFDSAVDDFDEFVEGKFNVDGDGDIYEGERHIINMVTSDTPAYESLLGFGLINDDGTPSSFVDSDPDDKRYPFVVTPDGQRISYVVHGEHEFSWAETDQCYVEDRLELRHIHDGIMPVTEEGDGVQIDTTTPILIEDVRGTVVGNDPHTEAGRQLYKKILTMNVFNSDDQQGPAGAPEFGTIDTAQDMIGADTQALARLFRVFSPKSSNQYSFGISKEGRVFLHVPAGQTGVDDKGKSVDMNIVGLIKAIIGADPTRTSLDLKTMGGVKLDIGAFSDDVDPDDTDTPPELVSIDLTLKGKIRTNYAGPQGRECFIGGNDFSSVAGSQLSMVQGSVIRNVGAAEVVEAFTLTHNAGAGGYKQKCAGDYNNTVLGKTSELYAQVRLSVFALADTKTMIAGVDTTTVLAGGILRTVTAGTGITDTTVAGNHAMNVGAGNMLMNVGTGNLTANVGAGNLALTAGGGPVTITSGLTATLVAGTVAQIASPITKIGLAVVGSAVAGAPGPPGPHLDYITGLPILGVPTVTLG